MSKETYRDRAPEMAVVVYLLFAALVGLACAFSCAGFFWLNVVLA